MKRILLTTTSLVLAAGVAQADVSFSGTTGVALIDDNGKSDATRVDMFFESYYDFDVTASAESDNGVSVSVGFDMGAGNKIDYNDDDELEAQGNSIADADVAVSYAGWTLTVD
ncbi:MAG: porin, partial [Planktomarina temperata]|nr:porin [Planktomarina temperata]